MQSCDCQLTQECDIQKLESFRREGFSEGGVIKGRVKTDGVIKRRVQRCGVVRGSGQGVGHHDEWEGDLM